MILVKFGLLAMFGKQFYSGLISAQLIQQTLHSVKRKLIKKWEASK